MKVLYYFLFVISVVQLGCTQQSGGAKDHSIISDQFKDEKMIFENDVPLFVAMIKLKIPALLATVEKDANGKAVINAAQAQAMEEEQEELKKSLQSISSDIKVVISYKMVLNALAIEAPQSLADKISELNVEFIEGDEQFSQPKAILEESQQAEERFLDEVNSMGFIGIHKIHKDLGIKGQGMKVGIIDSGIDYTHSMFGGAGTKEAFAAIDASQGTESFPTLKVVGGKDFVGAVFNTGSHLYKDHIPQPDMNPLDQSGHGSHVAGTVAGIGDGINTYDGAAPEAELYALKVFSDGGGSTSDTVVIAALEFAADPNGDGDLSDQLDVVNLSLGGGFGKPHSLYSQAIGNLVGAGTLVVASAGNSGPVANIVGSPSTADAAISVAASLDNMEHNWKFDAVEFASLSNPQLLVESVEGDITKKISEAGDVQGQLVYIGDATVDLTPDQLAELSGHVALIDRGEISFVEKIIRAQGAIGIVMVNNREGPAIVMGGDQNFDIPGIMVTKAIGETLKQEMALGSVTIKFQVEDKISKPELIDTLTSFSSQGPRSLDGLIKPEISAPGLRVISARMGSGNEGTKMGGTSMSSPHMAGVMVLLKQYRSDLTAHQLKALVMNTSMLMSDVDGVNYPISRQGAGRVQAFKAATVPLLLDRHSISLGEVQVETKKVMRRTVNIKNISSQPADFSFAVLSSGKMTVTPRAETTNLAPGESTAIELDISIDATDQDSMELDAFLQVMSGGEIVAQLPLMAIVNRLTRMSVEQLTIKASSMDEANGAAVDLTLTNDGLNTGEALIFNLLGRDQRKIPSFDPFLSLACDMESSGYRVIEREGRSILQVGIKLFNPVNSWGNCFVAVELDSDNDQVAEQEIYGSFISSMPGLDALEFGGRGSILFDSVKLAEINQEYEVALAAQPAQEPPLNYLPALVSIGPMSDYSHSTVTVVEADLGNVSVSTSGELNIRTLVSYNGGNAIEADDFLSDSRGFWKTINVKKSGAGYHDIPERVVVPQRGTVSVPLTKGDKKSEELLVYYPRNRFILALTGSDGQSQIPNPVFEFSEILSP